MKEWLVKHVRKKFEHWLLRGRSQLWLAGPPTVGSILALSADWLGAGALCGMVALAAMYLALQVVPDPERNILEE